jgi:hypothetical protein
VTAARSGVGAALAVCAERLGADATGVLARLGGRIGSSAREVAAELAALDAAARKRARAEAAVAARQVPPPGLRMVHASWIEAALAALPPRARASLDAAGATALDVWLARWVTATMPPMPVVPHGALEHKLAGDRAGILDWLVDVGADQVAFAVGDAAAARGQRLARAHARIALPPRRDGLGPKRAALERCRGVSLDDERSALLVIGARSLAPHLAVDPVAALQLTRRLPSTDGIRIAAVLAAHAADPVAHAPTWTALLAPP